MATPPSDDTRTLFKLLVDGKWHPYLEIREALAATVPPGRALRKYEERYKQNRRGHQEVVTPPISEDEQIVFGARACAQITITSWKGRGVQHRVVDDVKQIRVDPNYNGWGVILPSHEKGDEEAGGSPEVPPDDSEPPTVAHEPGNDPSPPAVDEPVAQEPIAPVTPDLPPPVAITEQPSQSVTSLRGPACDECGLLVSDQARHDRWHERRTKELERPDMALLDEVAMRTLLGDVMGQALTDFQKGMQGWLLQQFTQLAMAFGASQSAPPWLAPGRQQGSHRHK